MRKIDPNNFRIATRGTPRQINRQIALNLVRSRPISRAELARSMNMRRGAVSLLVNELIEEGIIFEGAPAKRLAGGNRSSSSSIPAPAARWLSIYGPPVPISW